MSLHANNRNMPFDQKSPGHREVGVLNCHKSTDRHCDSMTESSQWSNSVKMWVLTPKCEIWKYKNKQTFFHCSFSTFYHKDKEISFAMFSMILTPKSSPSQPTWNLSLYRDPPFYYCPELYNTKYYYTHCIILNSIVVHCSALHYTVLSRRWRCHVFMALQTPPIVWTIEQTLVTKLLQQSDTYDKFPVIQPSDIAVTLLPDNISTVVWPRL